MSSSQASLSSSSEKECSFLSLWHRIATEDKVIFFATFITGFFCHAMALYNRYTFGDGLNIAGFGVTWRSGRWAYGLLTQLDAFLFESSHFASPSVLGIIVLIFISFSAVLVRRLFDIKRIELCIFTGMCMVTIPCVASLMGYIYDADAYSFALFLSVCGAYCICKKQTIAAFVLGVVCIGFSMGIYQAYLPLAASLMLIYFIKLCLDFEKNEWSWFAKSALRFLVAGVAACVFYYVCNSCALFITGEYLGSYKGINSFGYGNYPARIVDAYKEFFFPVQSIRSSMFPFGSLKVYYLLMIATISLCVAYFISLNKAKKLNTKKIVQFVALLVCLPVFTHLIYIMTDPADVHGLMVYAIVTPFIFLAMMADRVCANYKGKPFLIAYCVLLLVMFLLPANYIRYDNAHYLRSEYQQTQQISYLTTMVTQIKSTDGFTDKTPVALVRDDQVYDKTITVMKDFKSMVLNPYGQTAIKSTVPYLQRYMMYWCDFDPTWADGNSFADKDEVQQMPSYPDSGSIRNIEGTIVVKLS